MGPMAIPPSRVFNVRDRSVTASGFASERNKGSLLEFERFDPANVGLRGRITIMFRKCTELPELQPQRDRAASCLALKLISG